MVRFSVFRPFRLLALLCLCLAWSTGATAQVSPLGDQPGDVSPTQQATAEALVSRFDMPEAWLNYRQFRFSQQHPHAPGAFFSTIEPELQALGQRMADSLTILYTQRMDEAQLLDALGFVRTPLGTRYNHFRRDGLWARTRPSWFWEAARAMEQSSRRDSTALRRHAASGEDQAWIRFSRHFVELPDLPELKKRLRRSGDSLQRSNAQWERLRDRAADSAAVRIAVVARDFLGAPERDSLLRVFDTRWGRYLDPQQRQGALRATTEDYRRRVDQRIRQRWRLYEYRSSRYPEQGEVRDFRSQELHFAFIGECPGNGQLADALDWRYEGLAWIVEAPGAKSEKELARLERWLQDWRFSPEGEHRIYFVRKPLPLPASEGLHPDGTPRAISPESLEAHMLTLPPKKRSLVVGLYHIVDGQGTWQAHPFGR